MAKNEILDAKIDESVAEYILTKVENHIEQLDSAAAKYEAKLKAQYEAKQEKLFKGIDKIVAESEEEIKKDYSARYLSKIEALNQRIAEAEEEKEEFKGFLSERVNAFLANSKEEVRTIVEEEMKLDADNLRATATLDEIRALVGGQTVSNTISSVDESKIARLEEDIAVLKERLESKSNSNRKLKVQLKVHELADTVPTADREFFVSQLCEAETVEAVEEKFAKIKEVARKHRAQQLEEELHNNDSRGSVNEADDFDSRPDNQRQADSAPGFVNRWQTLAGIK